MPKPETTAKKEDAPTRAMPLSHDIFGAPVVLPGVDGAAGPQESTLAEISETLPAE